MLYQVPQDGKSFFSITHFYVSSLDERIIHRSELDPFGVCGLQCDVEIIDSLSRVLHGPL